MTYKRILAALDRSPLGEQVFAQALAIAKQQQASLLLLHCIPLEGDIAPYAPLYHEDLASFSNLIQENIKHQTEDVHQWLKELTEKAIAAGITPETDWKVGEPGRWIRDLSQSWNADLIIIGRRGLKGMAEMFLGSVSNYIVHHVRCSVLIVQGIEDKNV